MKKLLVALVLTMFATSAMAHGYGRGGYYGGYHGGYGGGYGWVAPLAIGGLIGYELSQPRTVVVTPPPVVYQQQPIIVQQAPSVLPPAPYGYHYENMLDANCNCYKTVLVVNQ